MPALATHKATGTAPVRLPLSGDLGAGPAPFPGAGGHPQPPGPAQTAPPPKFLGKSQRSVTGPRARWHCHLPVLHRTSSHLPCHLPCPLPSPCPYPLPYLSFLHPAQPLSLLSPSPFLVPLPSPILIPRPSPQPIPFPCPPPQPCPCLTVPVSPSRRRS